MLLTFFDRTSAYRIKWDDAHYDELTATWNIQPHEREKIHIHIHLHIHIHTHIYIYLIKYSEIALILNVPQSFS